jgi:hypothetical protein
MIFAPTATGPSASDVSLTTGMHQSEVVSASVTSENAPRFTTRGAFKQRILPLDATGQFLRLWDDAILELDILRQEVEVESWGVRVKMTDVETLPRSMARQFLRLWSASERGELEETDDRHWQAIVERVDFQSFCNGRGSPRYVEGELLRRSSDSIRVKWPDGREELLCGLQANALMMVDPGEMFSATVTLDATERVRTLDNCMLLGDAGKLLQEMDDEWILKR